MCIAPVTWISSAAIALYMFSDIKSYVELDMNVSVFMAFKYKQ